MYVYIWRLRIEVYPVSYLSPKDLPNSCRIACQSLVAIFLVFRLSKNDDSVAQNKWRGAFALPTLDKKQNLKLLFSLFCIRSSNFHFVSLCNRSSNTNRSIGRNTITNKCKANVVIWLKQQGFILLFSVTTQQDVILLSRFSVPYLVSTILC